MHVLMELAKGLNESLKSYILITISLQALKEQTNMKIQTVQTHTNLHLGPDRTDAMRGAETARLASSGESMGNIDKKL